MPTHYKSGQWSPAFEDRNFVPGISASAFRFVSSGSPGAKWRDAPTRPLSRYNAIRRSIGAGTTSDDADDSRRFVLCTAFVAGEGRAQPRPSRPADDIARGKALTEAGDCASCHTADPAKPFAGGKRIDTPFGGIYSPNLTPDRDTGIGGWSDDDFYRALRYGVAPDGSRYYPAFPYPNFTKLTRQDIWRSGPIWRR